MFSEELQITSSFGVSTLSSGASSHSELVEQAGWALYEAKNSGRNCVVNWHLPGEEALVENTELSSETEGIESPDKTDVNSENMDEGKQTQTQKVIDHSSDSVKKTDESYQENTSFQQIAQTYESKQDVELSSSKVISLSSQILLFDRIEQAIKRAQRYDTRIAVMAVSVDALQRVNDTLGNAVGEKLARNTVSRLKQILRNTDTVTLTKQDELAFSISRLGNNEIVALLTDLNETDIVTSILQRVFSANNEPVEVEGDEYYLNTDVGVSVYPHDGKDSDALLRNANSALHEVAERAGRNNIQFFAEDINQRSKRRIKLEAELHRALERSEFMVYYQPKVDLKTGSILGVEALIRWQHPQLGIVPPNEFIPLAEQTGLIEDIDRWVVRNVCRQIKLWQEAGHGVVKVAVNLSPAEFRNPDLADEIISLINKAEIPVDALEVEITEGVVMQDLEAAKNILEKLSEVGLNISLDDFGTGYSSLSYLKRFPLDKVKIDRSFITDFVHGTNDAAIVSAIIAMSHSLGLRVVAEGVETEEQLRFLQDLQCDETQGYLISKALPRDGINKLLAQPSAIRRMIVNSSHSNPAMNHEDNAFTATGMIGVINDFPELQPRQSKQKNKNSVVN